MSESSAKAEVMATMPLFMKDMPIYVLEFYDLRDREVETAHFDLDWIVNKAIEQSKVNHEYTYKIETYVDGCNKFGSLKPRYFADGEEFFPFGKDE